MTSDEYLTRAEAAERAGVSVRTIDAWRRKGLLATYTPVSGVRGRRGGDGWIRVRHDELLELLDYDLRWDR